MKSAEPVLIMLFAVCAACGSSGNGTTPGASTGQTPAPAPTAGVSSSGGNGTPAAPGTGGSSVSRAGGSGVSASSSGAGTAAVSGRTGSTPLAGTTGTAGAGNAGSAGASTPSLAATHPGVPPDVAQALGEWPLPGRDYNNSRYTKDSTINSSTVTQLKEAWKVEFPSFPVGYGSCSTVPLILGGTVYIEDTLSSVRAIDLASGKVKWLHEESNLNAGPNGVAVGWGKVFGTRGTDSVVAYDAASGKELWVKKVSDTATAGIDIQPTVFEGQVLISTVPISTNGIYTGGDRGILKALDQMTGEEKWRFDTIESKDFWGNEKVNSGGGSWYPPSIDLQTGRVFWAVANPAPFPGTAEFPNGTSRPGSNLYTDSTVVLDAKTGAYQWHHQTVEHDLFDRDLLHTMLTEVGGMSIVVSTGKEGRVWANLRDTGKVLWGPVPVGKHMNDDLTELKGDTKVLPGSFGGVLTPPALAEGVIYVAALNAPTTYKPNETAYFGSEVGSDKGSLVALDAATGKILWDVPVDGDPTGGATVINDLVFTATFQGKVFAFDRMSGKQVWSWTAPGGINAWMTASGNTLVVPVGSANPGVIVGLQVGSTGPVMTTGASGSGAAGSGSAGRPASEANPNSFSKIFNEILSTKCAGPVCHSSNSTGAFSMPAGANASTVRGGLLNKPAAGSACITPGLSLVSASDPDKSLLYLKVAGMPPCGGKMPPTGALSAEEISRIRTWIANGALDN